MFSSRITRFLPFSDLRKGIATSSRLKSSSSSCPSTSLSPSSLTTPSTVLIAPLRPPSRAAPNSWQSTRRSTASSCTPSLQAQPRIRAFHTTQNTSFYDTTRNTQQLLHQQFSSRPDGWWGKIRYRADGKPRSRLIGAAFVGLIALDLLTLVTLEELAEDSDSAVGLLVSIIYIQQADASSYHKTDLDDMAETMGYFKVLYSAFARVPLEEVDELFVDLVRMMDIVSANPVSTKDEDGEGQSRPQDIKAEAHKIMRHASEQVHIALQELTDDSISTTANYVLMVMKEALESLIDLVQDVDFDDGGDSKYTFQLIRDHSKKDTGVLKDYESLG